MKKSPVPHGTTIAVVSIAIASALYLALTDPGPVELAGVAATVAAATPGAWTLRE